MGTKREILRGGELPDYPGCWTITVTIEGESGEWSVFRKPDGTYWQVAGVHIFPPEGGNVRFDIGDQILDEKELTQCRNCYTQLQQKLAEQGVQ
jgi:hypothetical protein